MLKTTANKITMLRIVLVPVYMLLSYLDLNIAAFIAYIIACVSDFADGYIARHYNQVSNFGKFMDPLADKMLVLSSMCFFVDCGRMAGWVVALVLLREFAVSGLRLVAVENQRVIAAAWSGKIKTCCTMICLGAMMVLNFPIIDYISSALIVITTMWSGIEYFSKNIDVFNL